MPSRCAAFGRDNFHARTLASISTIRSAPLPQIGGFLRGAADRFPTTPVWAIARASRAAAVNNRVESIPVLGR